MANSVNYSQLTEVWVKWRDASGKHMRDKFIEYLVLGNKAAQLIDLKDQSNKSIKFLILNNIFIDCIYANIL